MASSCQLEKDPLSRSSVARVGVAGLQRLPGRAVDRGANGARLRVDEDEPITEPRDARRLLIERNLRPCQVEADRGRRRRLGWPSASGLAMRWHDADAIVAGDSVAAGDAVATTANDGPGTGGTTDGIRRTPEPTANAPPTISSAAAARSVMPRPRPNRRAGREEARRRRVGPPLPSIAARAIASASNGPTFSSASERRAAPRRRSNGSKSCIAKFSPEPKQQA